MSETAVLANVSVISVPTGNHIAKLKHVSNSSTAQIKPFDVTDDGGGGGGGGTSSNRRAYFNNELLKTSKDERLRTFNGWTVTFLQPEALASAMFYFTGQSDVVRCPICKVEVGRWEDGDDPLIDHRKWSPNCSFIHEQFNPETDTARANYSVEITGGMTAGQAVSGGHDTCGKYGIIQSHTSIPENSSIAAAASGRSVLPIGVQEVKQPTYKHYATLDKRLETFNDWPVSLAQKPKELTEAGFFYTGKSDQTVCFHCGGGLKDWESVDQPWQQHAKWFPKCPFVVLQKGMQYILEQQTTVPATTAAEPPLLQNQPHAVAAPVTALAPKAEEKGDEPSKETPDIVRCKICLDKEVGVVFLPCGHMVACVDCAPVLTTCAVCRANVDAYVRAFLS